MHMHVCIRFIYDVIALNKQTIDLMAVCESLHFLLWLAVIQQVENLLEKSRTKQYKSNNDECSAIINGCNQYLQPNKI